MEEEPLKTHFVLWIDDAKDRIAGHVDYLNYLTPFDCISLTWSDVLKLHEALEVGPDIIIVHFQSFSPRSKMAEWLEIFKQRDAKVAVQSSSPIMLEAANAFIENPFSPRATVELLEMMLDPERSEGHFYLHLDSITTVRCES